MSGNDTGLIIVGCVLLILLMAPTLSASLSSPPVLRAWDPVGYYEGTQSENIRLESFGTQYWRIDWYVMPGDDWPSAYFTIDVDGRVLEKSKDYSGSVWVSFDNLVTFVEIPLTFLPGKSASGYLIVEKPKHTEIRVSSNVRWQVYVFAGIID